MSKQLNPQVTPPMIMEKPKLRGWIHAATFPVAIALGIVLIAFSNGAAAITGAVIFMISSMALFGVSAL